MIHVTTTAQAGTLESSDVLITVAPAGENAGLEIEIDSTVLLQYGQKIRQTIDTVLAEQKITAARIKVVDRGALDCTIRARLLAALGRAGLAPGRVEQLL